MCTVDSPDAGDEAVVELSSCCCGCCCLNMEPVLDMSRGASGAACPDAGLMECEGMTGTCGSWLFDVEEED